MSKRFLLAAIIVLCGALYGSDDPRSLENRLVLPEWLGDSFQGMLDPDGDREIQPFIVNGQATNYAVYQAAVGLLMNTSQGQAICTASLIDEEVLLTAGHCVYLKEYNQLVYDAVSNPGSISVKNGANIMSNTLANAVQVKKHEGWTGELGWSVNNDVAMIKLDRKITDIDIFGLRDYPEDALGETGVIVGYGITYTGGYDSGTHRWGNAKVLTRDTGKKLIEVGNPSGTCQGDSGGPFLTTQNGMLVVSGITSFGGQTCYADRDGWDTWTIQYRDWIVNTLIEFTGHGLLSGGECGDGDDVCSQGQTLDCAQVDSKYETGTAAPCNGGCSWWDTSVCDPVCGDGSILPPEVCEAGMTADCGTIGQFLSGDTAPCADDCAGYNTAYCTATLCGDGLKEGNEFCDTDMTSCETLGDYNKYLYARCNTNCSGYEMSDCANGTILCGNGIPEALEQCDDGNNTSGDGCSSRCKTEGATAVCGNGTKEGAEQCDDGNKVNGDGCSAGCLLETTPVCGNGTKEGSEECDDGNKVNGDGCSAACLNEDPNAVCGNGTKESGEACDDGNLTPGDGCEPNCTVTPVECGNGIKETGEQCDDGNKNNGDGCSAACLTEDPNAVCGNGVKETGEQCDDGNTIPGDACNPDCTLPATGNAVCGNGILEAGEVCDDGNTNPGDGCDPDCTLPGTKPPTNGSSGCALIVL